MPKAPATLAFGQQMGLAPQAPQSLPAPITPQPVVNPTQSQQDVSQPTQTSGALDPKIVNLAQAIRQTESGGNFSAKGASGEYGGYQFMPDTWNATAPKYGVNVPLEQATPAQQNEVAYKQLADWSTEHPDWNVGNFASAWNAGPGKPDAYIQANVGTNSKGVNYDTPAYAQKVAQAYQQYKTQNAQNAPVGSPDQTNAQSPSLEGFGSNLLSSGANFAGNLINAVAHPLQTGQNLLETGAGAFQELGGQTNDNTAKFDQLKEYFSQRYGSPEQLLHTAYTDPVGLASDVSAALGIGGGFVGLAGKTAELSGLGTVAKVATETTPAIEASGLAGGLKTVSTGLKKGSTLTNPLTPVIGGVAKIGNATSGVTSNLVGRGIGVTGDDVKALVNGNVSVQDMENISRASIAQDIKTALDERDAHLSDTGSGYEPIKQAGEVPAGYENIKNAPPANAIPVASNFLEEEFRNTAKLEVKDGKILPSTVSNVGKTELTKLQDILDTFKPSFQRGYLSPEEFLTLRGRLADAAYNDSGIKNTKVAQLAEDIRNNLNTSYRTAIPGLEELDTKFSAEKTLNDSLRKGFLDRHGNLLEQATNKIANAGKAGKGATLARLEQIAPGITQRLEAMQMIERLSKALSGNGGGLTGAIMRAGETGGAIGGFAAGNLPVVAASLGTALLASPNLVIPVLRMIGDNKILLQGVISHLAKYATLGATAQNVSRTSSVGQTPTVPAKTKDTQPNLDVLASEKNFNLDAARKAGYSDKDISDYLSQ